MDATQHLPPGRRRFRSSRGLGAGCNLMRQALRAKFVQFQSSPGLGAGCKRLVAFAPDDGGLVSILTRLGSRVQQGVRGCVWCKASDRVPRGPQEQITLAERVSRGLNTRCVLAVDPAGLREPHEPGTPTQGSRRKVMSTEERRNPHSGRRREREQIAPALF